MRERRKEGERGKEKREERGTCRKRVRRREGVSVLCVMYLFYHSYPYDVDKMMTILKMVDINGTPLGMIRYNIHSNTLNLSKVNLCLACAET